MAVNIKKWFREEANIYFLQTSGDDSGGFKKDWVRKYYKEPCRTFPTGSTSAFTIEAQGVNYPVEVKLLCDIEVDIVKGDKVIVGDENFMVLRADKRKGVEGHHTACLLGRMEDE